MSNFKVSAPEGSSIPIMEAGAYPAVCIGIIDIGDQFNKVYDKYTRKCVFQFEIPSETIEIDGEQKPRVISATYTASLAEKSNLRKTLESWRGREFTKEELTGFDLENVLGAPCMLNVIHKESAQGNTFANISAITRMPKGYEVRSNTEKIIFSLNDTDALEKMAKLPEWIQARIKESSQYMAMTTAPVTVGSLDEYEDEQPF